MSRWYVGHTGTGLEAFSSPVTPTATLTPQYGAVVGPFRTKRAALWAEKHGYLNPHFQHVNDAERLSRKEND